MGGRQKSGRQLHLCCRRCHVKWPLPRLATRCLLCTTSCVLLGRDQPLPLSPAQIVVHLGWVAVCKAFGRKYAKGSTSSFCENSNPPFCSSEEAAGVSPRKMIDLEALLKSSSSTYAGFSITWSNLSVMSWTDVVGKNWGQSRDSSDDPLLGDATFLNLS